MNELQATTNPFTEHLCTSSLVFWPRRRSSSARTSSPLGGPTLTYQAPLYLSQKIQYTRIFLWIQRGDRRPSSTPDRAARAVWDRRRLLHPRREHHLDPAAVRRQHRRNLCHRERAVLPLALRPLAGRARERPASPHGDRDPRAPRRRAREEPRSDQARGYALSRVLDVRGRLWRRPVGT